VRSDTNSFRVEESFHTPHSAFRTMQTTGASGLLLVLVFPDKRCHRAEDN